MNFHVEDDTMFKQFFKPRLCLIPRSIFITGASSGLGKALALAYAAPNVTLFLCGRNIERLDQVAKACKKTGATVYTFAYDVAEASVSESAIKNANRLAPLDLVIANAGVSGAVLGASETGNGTLNLFQTNIWGVAHTVLPAINCFKERKSGQIAIISSMAGYRGMPSCPAYSASKNCVKAWGEGLRGHLKSRGIAVSVVCPGFIETPLTDKNHFHMPLIMTPQKAAQKIKKRLELNQGIIAFPWPMVFGAWFMSILPSVIAHPIMGALPKKEK